MEWECVYWINLAQDRDHWQAFVNPVMNAGYEILTPVVMKSTILWDVTPCSTLKHNRRFGGTYSTCHLLSR
jgi:hypothetical protein